MSEGFANPIVGGGGALVYPSIHSPDYVPGFSGWSIDKDGNAEFNSILLPPGAGGNTVFVQGTQPVANQVDDIWINTAAGNQITTWTGAAWSAQQLGTGAIAAGAVTAALIAANTITAAQIAANTITAAQIAAGTITAAQIAAGTITAAKIAAGIVLAGAVNGTTISGAQFIAFGTSGEILVYAGTPAFGNLLLSVSAVSGTDGQGNPYIGPGVYVYNSSGGSVGLTPGANTALQLTPGVTPMIVAGTAQVFANAAGHVVVQDGGDAQAYQTQRRTLVAGSNSGTLTALSTVFAQSLGPQQYRVHGQLYVAVAVAGAEFECKFLGSGTLTGQFAFTIEHGAGTNSVTQNGAPNTAVNTGTTQGVGVWVVVIDGTLAQTVAAVLDFQVGSATATGLVVNAQSFLEFMPV